jgi:hypothetical protein
MANHHLSVHLLELAAEQALQREIQVPMAIQEDLTVVLVAEAGEIMLEAVSLKSPKEMLVEVEVVLHQVVKEQVAVEVRVLLEALLLAMLVVRVVMEFQTQLLVLR